MLASPGRSVMLLSVVALAAVVMLAASSIVLASDQVTRVVDKQVQTTAAVSSVVVGNEMAGLMSLVESYATRPSLASGMVAGGRGNAAVAFDLASLARAIPGISASFVTDLQGTSLSTYPPEPSVYGTNFAYREWFKGLVASGRPFLSNAIVTKEASHALAVTVTDYIAAPDGRRVGILGVNYSLQSIGQFAANVGRAQGITLTVTDRAGTSLTAGGAHGLVSLAGDPRVRAALAGRSGLLSSTPALPGGGHGPAELSAYTSVPGTGWTVIAAVRKSVAFSGLGRLRDTVLGIALLLVLIMIATIRIVARSDRHRRESERRLQSQDRQLARVLGSTHEAFVSTDGAGDTTVWNAGAEKLYGWAATEVLGRNLRDTVLPGASSAANRGDLARYHAGRDLSVVGSRMELTAMHRDGHEFPVEVSSWPHADGEGFSAFMYDITERATIQSELQRARDQALQASRLKSEFLANMSHEIRTPMNGVIGMSSLLLDTDLDTTQRDYAETVCSSAEALLTVIDDILDFSKIEAGKLDVECVTFDLRSVVEESAVLLAARAQHDGLELICRIDPALPGALEGDPGRVRQVLLNLLGNAVKFTSVGEVNVTARHAGTDLTGAITVELSVSDTGIGIPAATQEHLFDAFTQADSSTSRRYGGTGLGLAISRQLVELMGGTLSVTSAPDAGSTFTALIPFGISAATAGQTHVADLVGVRALIVDDNLTNQRVLQEMVAAWGCSAGVAEGAKEALAMLRDAVDDGLPFDVLLLDLNMPDIDGYALARMVSGDPRLADTPMVMLTSSAQRGETERTQQAGIVAYLTKPVRSARLRSALNIALGSTVATDPSGSPRRGSDPRHDVNAPADEADRVSAGARHSDHGGASEATAADCVLVVEDHLVNQKVLTAMLAKLGYQADIAVNGFEAVEAVRRNHYVAVLMDCQMPGMDGYEAVEKIRQSEGHERHTYVIAVTATAMTGDRDRCLAAGMDDYLAKPVSVESLAAVLARWAPGHAWHETPADRAPRAPEAGDLLVQLVTDRIGAVPDSDGVMAPALDPEIVGRLERLGADAGEDLMGQLSTLFLAHADIHVSELRSALASEDNGGMVRSAHTLRGASANVGATALASLCATLEADSATGDLVASGAQLDALETELARVRSALGLFTAKP